MLIISIISGFWTAWMHLTYPRLRPCEISCYKWHAFPRRVVVTVVHLYTLSALPLWWVHCGKSSASGRGKWRHTLKMGYQVSRFITIFTTEVPVWGLFRQIKISLMALYKVPLEIYSMVEWLGYAWGAHGIPCGTYGLCFFVFPTWQIRHWIQSVVNHVGMEVCSKKG